MGNFYVEMIATATHNNRETVVADPGFPREGRNPRQVGANLLFGKILAQNCMKMKEIEKGGGVPAHLRSTTLHFLDPQRRYCNTAMVFTAGFSSYK